MKSIKRERELFEGTFSLLHECNKGDEHSDWSQVSEFIRPAKKLLTELEESKFKDIEHNILIDWIRSPFLDDLVSGKTPVLSIIRTGKLKLFHEYFTIEDLDIEVNERCEEEIRENDFMTIENIEATIRLEYLLAAFSNPGSDNQEFIIEHFKFENHNLTLINEQFDDWPEECINLIKSKRFNFTDLSISDLYISDPKYLPQLEEYCKNLYKDIDLYRILEHVSQEVLVYIVKKFNLYDELREIASLDWPAFNRHLMKYALELSEPKQTYIQWLNNVIEEYKLTKKNLQLGFSVGFKLSDRFEQFHEEAFVILMRKSINENDPDMINYIIKQREKEGQMDLKINNYEYFYRSAQVNKSIHPLIPTPPAVLISYHEDFSYYEFIIRYNIDRLSLLVLITRLLPLMDMLYVRQIVYYLIHNLMISKEELLKYNETSTPNMIAITLIYNILSRQF